MTDGVCLRRPLIHSQGTTSPKWIPPQHSTQSWRRGMPHSSECSDGWSRSDELTSSRKYRKWNPMPQEGHLNALLHMFGFLRICIIHGWCTIHRTPQSTWTFSNLTIGKISMEMSWSKSLATCRNRAERTLTYDYMSTVTMLGRSACAVCIQASLSS